MPRIQVERREVPLKRDAGLPDHHHHVIQRFLGRTRACRKLIPSDLMSRLKSFLTYSLSSYLQDI
jgi:hypothetical protein